MLDWRADLNVGVDFMDHDHAVAADLINRLGAADLVGRQELMGEFITHCREHFAREEEMMQAIGFFAFGCHQGEHERVLEELARVAARLAEGQPQDAYFTQALPGWLLDHRGSMDLVTAGFARQKGY